MFESIGIYAQLLLAVVLATTFLIAAFSFRKRWNSPPSRLRLVLSEPLFRQETSPDRLASLLLYEDTHRAFSDLLGLVLEKYPVQHLEQIEDFSKALDFLNDAAYRREDEKYVRSAMCQVVQVLLEDPDVEYSCRPEFSSLLNSFLDEADAQSRTAR